MILSSIEPIAVPALDWTVPMFKINDKNAIVRHDDNIYLAAGARSRS